MNNPKRRTALFAAGLMTIALTATACGSGGGGSSSEEDAGKPVKGGTLNMLGIGDVDYVDPNITYYSAGSELARMFSRSLFTFPAEEGKTNTVVPDLAEEVPTTDNGGISSDGKSYTIKLRSGVKWNTSPSRPVTAEDVVRGVKRTCNPVQPFGGSTNYTTLIEGMEKFCADFAELGADATPADLTKFIDSNELPGVVAKDDSTLVIKLVQPAAYFADMLALAAFSPAPVEVMKYVPGSAELGKNQVASGPYKIDKYDPTKSIELSRNPDWDPSTDPVRKAYVDKIVIDETGDQSAIQQQLETNTKSADMAWDTFPTAQQVPGLQAKKDPNLTISETSSSNPYIQYNFKSPNNGKAMAKLEFRQALSHAINRDNIIQVLGGKVLNEPLTHVLPPAIRGSEDTEDYYPYDVAKAKSLMSEAGVSSPTLKVLYRNDSTGSTKTFETLQEDLGKVGIKVTGVPANQADFYTKYLQSPEQAGEGAFDLAIAGWGSDWYGNAAKSYFSPLFAGKPAFPPNGSNFAFYDNPETNKLIDEASAAPDDESDALWAEADKKVMEDAAFYPITSPKTANYHAKHLHNTVPMEAFQNYDPTNVWIEKAYQD